LIREKKSWRLDNFTKKGRNRVYVPIDKQINVKKMGSEENDFL